MLLHSEQSTLDSLSAGFNDRYTVHCATSGSEALTTLGETPINVIISAQDLPGMSGVEALREAKKRSPETIGILLVGQTEEGLEALVSDKEVFQVVRGDITGDKLPGLVDNATQQMRLMALAESANDMAANLDEPAAEHIVMETSENGSSIISDGTGQFPALNPKRISAAAAAGAQAVDVLVLTKDEEFLSTIKESARGMHKIHYANTLKQADESIRKHKIGVAVVDAAMVGDKIEQLTQHLRKGSPRLVPVVAGRRDDGEMLMDLINRGKLYRFLLKPVSPGRARLAVEASVKHHLEAPDAAFKTKGAAAPARPEPKPEPKPAARPAPQPAPAAKAKPASQPAPEAKPKATPAPAKKSKGPAPVPSDPPLHAPGAASSPVAAGGAAERPVAMQDTLAGLESPAFPGGAVASLASNPKVIGIAAAAVIVVAAALFWFSGGEDESEAIAVQEPVATSVPSPAEANVAADEPEPQPGIDLEAALGSAETALLESRLDDAEAALQRVAAADPDNSRLAFLTAQLQQEQLRGHLAEARAAIRDTRFEDATNAIAAARALAVTDASEVEAVSEELTAARSAQRVDETLALAAARLEEGSLLRPANDNARYYYELVLANDPSNTAARQGLDVVASRLVLQARAQIDAGNLDASEALLRDAREIDASNADLAITGAALLAARDAIAANERREAEARRQAEAERQAAEQRAAEQRAAEERAAEERAAEELAAAAAAAAAAAQEEAEPANEPPVDIRDQAPVSVSALKRTRYVAPRYPRAAQRRQLGGWVDIAFTVAVDGSVKDIDVGNSEPEGMFEDAATRAVEKWEFEPHVEDGVAVERRAAVRISFALE
ncbi:MAG: TonB family protein [Gammaproteobacteria bacterium]|nr:TonB family protein [Gammaproteobacteria bacterium]